MSHLFLSLCPLSTVSSSFSGINSITREESLNTSDPLPSEPHPNYQTADHHDGIHSSAASESAVSCAVSAPDGDNIKNCQSENFEPPSGNTYSTTYSGLEPAFATLPNSPKSLKPRIHLVEEAGASPNFGRDVETKEACGLKQTRWQPSFRRIAPLMGLTALTFTILQSSRLMRF